MKDISLDNILELLQPFENKNIPLTKSAISRLIKHDRDEFYNFLTNPIKKILISIEREKCPITNKKHPALAQSTYKRQINRYILQWGYSFKSPVSITPSLFEATANYLEKNK